MIVPDINLLLDAYDADSPFHAQAAAWWQQCLTGADPVALPPVVLFGFVRLSTNARVLKNPITPAEAAQHIRPGWCNPACRFSNREAITWSKCSSRWSNSARREIW